MVLPCCYPYPAYPSSVHVYFFTSTDRMMDGGGDDDAAGAGVYGSSPMISGRKRKADDDNYLDGDELGIVMGMNMNMAMTMVPLSGMHGDGNAGGDGGSSASGMFCGSETGDISHHIAIADATGNDIDTAGGGYAGGGVGVGLSSGVGADADADTATATSTSQVTLDDTTRFIHGYHPVPHTDTFPAPLLALAPACAPESALAPAPEPVEEIDDMHRRQALDWQPPKRKTKKRKIDTATKRPGYELVKAALLRYR